MSDALLPVRTNPPGPRNLPLIGALLPFRKDPLGFLVENRVLYGDVVAYRFGPAAIVQLNNPDDIDAVLLHKQMHKDEITRRLSSLLGNGLVNSEGDFWRRQRKLAAPAFQRKHIDAYADTMVACTNAWLDKLGADAVRDVHHEMMGLTHEIVLRTLLGTSVPADEEGVGDSIGVYMTEFQSESQGWRRLLPHWVPTPGRRLMTRSKASIDGIVHKVIAEKRTRPTEASDVLSRLLAARDDDGQPMSDAQLRDEAVTFFVAGHETTALALTYVFHLLGQHPQVLQKLVDEVDGLGKRALTAADEAALPYTRAVVTESMRVLPPVWAIGREAQADTEIGGWAIPKGTEFFLAQYVVHRDPRFFQDSEKFEPERWLDGLEKRLPRCAYFPFGGGPRICIGNHFAMLEAILCLATIVQRTRFEAAPSKPLRLIPSVTLRPATPVNVRFVAR
jgi:cytochrome P450